MDYPLENLDPERFQQLCQSLLVKAFPHLQCFPVAQPDGGRDAVSFIPDGDSDKFMVFQATAIKETCHQRSTLGLYPALNLCYLYGPRIL